MARSYETVESESDVRLPRGRHGLSPEVVERHQRDRVSSAVAATLAEHGYEGLTVERIVVEAQISRSTFYVHYANKQDAVLAAHDLIFERLLETIAQACEGDAEWPEKVNDAIVATLEFVAAQPEQAQLLSVAALSANVAISKHLFDSHDRLADLLRETCRTAETARLPVETERILITGIASIVTRHLVNSESGQLLELAPGLVESTLATYMDVEAAARVARGA